MSYALKQAATLRFEATANELRMQLASRGTDTLDQMRLTQGKIQGLRLAMDLLDETMKELMGEK